MVYGEVVEESIFWPKKKISFIDLDFRGGFT